MLTKLADALLRRRNLRLYPDNQIEDLRALEADIAPLFDLIAASQGIAEGSKSQIGQDMFALMQTGFKRNGYFVDFGATDGISMNNSYLLEKYFGWTGILAEPAPVWHADLLRNRSAKIDLDCVWHSTGEELQFNMSESPELSAIATLDRTDGHSAARARGQMITVRTVSLNDLLERHGAPAQMDYLSIDTEGSELAILGHLDFDRYSFSVITCEHNHAPDREGIRALLESKGYERRMIGLSRWDDWYVHADLAARRAR